MGRYLVCKYKFCESKQIPNSLKDTLAHEVKVSESTGRKQNLYFHPECYEKHVKYEAFLEKEREEKNEMNEVVKRLYGVQYQLPPRFWEYVSDLREGTNRYERKWKKKYKKGIPFSVMAEAYRMSKADIEWARFNKNFKTLDGELNYGIMIMLSKVNDAYKRLKAKEQQTKIATAIEQQQVEMMADDREVVYKKKSNGDDLTFLLGDD
ncbi:hypothetical protein NW825_06310 [Brevibacillus laterosporus]|nr:hypothetical protein [Brevibacillus laterosporus]